MKTQCFTPTSRAGFIALVARQMPFSIVLKALSQEITPGRALLLHHRIKTSTIRQFVAILCALIAMVVSGLTHYNGFIMAVAGVCLIVGFIPSKAARSAKKDVAWGVLTRDLAISWKSKKRKLLKSEIPDGFGYMRNFFDDWYLMFAAEQICYARATGGTYDYSIELKKTRDSLLKARIVGFIEIAHKLVLAGEKKKALAMRDSLTNLLDLFEIEWNLLDDFPWEIKFGGKVIELRSPTSTGLSPTIPLKARSSQAVPLQNETVRVILKAEPRSRPAEGAHG